MGTQVMSTQSVGRGLGRRAIGAACALLAIASTVRAQGDSVRVVIKSNDSGGFEAEVERVARQLVEKKRMQLSLVRSVQVLTNQLQQLSDDAARGRVEQQVRLLRTRLAATGNEGAELRRELGELCLENRRPDGWLGIVLDSDVELKRMQGVVTSRYLEYPEIVSVEPGSPAQKAGVEAGDRLLMLNGRDVRTPDLRIGEMLRPGAQLPIRVRRGLDTRTLQVLVERRPDTFDPPCRWVDQAIVDALREVPDEGVFVRVPDAPLPPPALAPTPAPQSALPRVAPTPPPVGAMVFTFSQNGPGTIAGAQLTALNEELGEPFGVERGVLVLKVLPGTPAEQAGLRGGDVILAVNGGEVADPSALIRAMNVSRSRELQLRVQRKKKPLTVALRW